MPLPPEGSCNIGSLDISKFLKEDNSIDWETLEVGTRLAVRFLDAVIDNNYFPTQKMEDWALENRPVAVGIMGYADMLLMRETAYGSEEALRILEEILDFMQTVEIDESEKLGQEKGVPLQCQKLSRPRRNITVNTVAPTGTTSLIAGCSSGLEPVFSEITIRTDKTGTYTFTSDLASKPYFRCAVASNGAKEVTLDEHVQTLAATQRYIQSGVSKTCNIPTHTRRETIEKAVIQAWESGCKGITVYRNGSRKVEVLKPKNLKKDKCPVCGNELVEKSGKMRCLVCKEDRLIEDTVASYDS